MFSTIVLSFIAMISLYSFLLLVKTRLVCHGSFGGEHRGIGICDDKPDMTPSCRHRRHPIRQVHAASDPVLNRIVTGEPSEGQKDQEFINRFVPSGRIRCSIHNLCRGFKVAQALGKPWSSDS